MTLTPEQQEIFDRVKSAVHSRFENNIVLHVDAKAGTGKTTLVKYITEQFPALTFIYTAFNKKIVDDGVHKFGKDNCKTFHALAYKYTTYPTIGNLYPNMIKSKMHLTYTDKKTIVELLDKYCLSRYLDIDDFFAEYGATPLQEDLIVTYLDKLADREIPITFNYMLKELHHKLSTGDIRIEVDLLFVDEAQDLTPVMLEIFGYIQATAKIYLGDTSQDIYSFLDLVSAFTLSVDSYDLTTSFRLMPHIAERIEPFCQEYIDSEFKLVGIATTKSHSDKTKGFITYTNAEIIEHIILCQGSGIGFSLTRPVKEIFEIPLAVNDIIEGKENRNPKYWKLKDFLRLNSPTTVAKQEELEEDVRSAVLLNVHLRKKGIDIRAVLDRAMTEPLNPDYLIATAHSVKGIELGTVTISNGLNKYTQNLIQSSPFDDEAAASVVEACKLYYVACSRAKHTLLNAKLL